MVEGNKLMALVKETPQILGTIYGDLAQPSVKKVGMALETVFDFSNTLLLPIKLLNEKVKLNFEKNLNDYKRKLDNVAEENINNVSPQLGTPIIERLSYVTNDEIADMFTTLLTKASSRETVNQAHPGFVQLIDRLSVDEARIIKYLNNKDKFPCVTFAAHFADPNQGFVFILENATLINFEIDLNFKSNINTYLDNLVSMGILNNSHGNYFTDDSIYQPLITAHRFEELSKQIIELGYSKLNITKGYYQITHFGKLFISACNF